MAENRTKLEWRNWQWWATILLAAFVGAALVKAPAATWGLLVLVWKKVLLISSLGIQQLRDLPYSLAAQNPYDLVAVVIIVTCSWWAPYVIARMFSLDNRGLPYWIADLFKNSNLLLNRNIDKPRNKAVQELSIRRLASMSLGMNIAGMLLTFFIYVASINIATAIALRSIYENKAAILAPILNPEQRVDLNAIFANMRTKKDWDLLTAVMKTYSDQNGHKLFPPGRSPFQ